MFILTVKARLTEKATQPTKMLVMGKNAKELGIYSEQQMLYWLEALLQVFKITPAVGISFVHLVYGQVRHNGQHSTSEQLYPAHCKRGCLFTPCMR